MILVFFPLSNNLWMIFLFFTPIKYLIDQKKWKLCAKFTVLHMYLQQGICRTTRGRVFLLGEVVWNNPKQWLFQLGGWREILWGFLWLVGWIFWWWFCFSLSLVCVFDCGVSPSSLFLKSFLHFSGTRLPCRAVREHFPGVWWAGVGSSGSQKQRCGVVLRLQGSRWNGIGGIVAATMHSSPVVPVIPGGTAFGKEKTWRKPTPRNDQLECQPLHQEWIKKLYLWPWTQEDFFFLFSPRTVMRN